MLRAIVLDVVSVVADATPNVGVVKLGLTVVASSVPVPLRV